MKRIIFIFCISMAFLPGLTQTKYSFPKLTDIQKYQLASTWNRSGGFQGLVQGVLSMGFLTRNTSDSWMLPYQGWQGNLMQSTPKMIQTKGSG